MSRVGGVLVQAHQIVELLIIESKPLGIEISPEVTSSAAELIEGCILGYPESLLDVFYLLMARRTAFERIFGCNHHHLLGQVSARQLHIDRVDEWPPLVMVASSEYVYFV